MYAIAPKHRNQGLGTEAAMAALAWGFNVVGLERIVGRCGVENLASRRVLEKVGMNLERGDPTQAEGPLEYSLGREQFLA